MKIIDMADHKGWGNSIYWLDYEKRELTGHLTPVPEIGDEIICEVKSLNKLKNFKIYIVVKVKDFDDPPDQFFATVKDSGYIIRCPSTDLMFKLNSKCPVCKKKFKRNFMAIDRHMGKKHRELLT